MKKRWTRTLKGAAVVLYVLHNDWWFWDDPQFALGLPIGLLYHLLFCLVAAILFLLFVFDEERSGHNSDTTQP